MPATLSAISLTSHGGIADSMVLFPGRGAVGGPACLALATTQKLYGRKSKLPRVDGNDGADGVGAGAPVSPLHLIVEDARASATIAVERTHVPIATSSRSASRFSLSISNNARISRMLAALRVTVPAWAARAGARG